MLRRIPEFRSVSPKDFTAEMEEGFREKFHGRGGLPRGNPAMVMLFRYGDPGKNDFDGLDS